jgi:hypothetical protein
MNWFIAKIVFKIEGKNQEFIQFDEQIRLLDAVNEDLALEMAHQFGLMQQDEVVAHVKGKLFWKFIGVTEINYLGEITNGTQVHCQINEPLNVSNYISLALAKAEGLKQRKLVC